MPPTNAHSRRATRQSADDQLVSLDEKPLDGRSKEARALRERTATERTASSASNQGSDTGEIRMSEEQDRGRNVTENTGEITRRSRNQRSIDTFAVPSNWKNSGWDYQFWTYSVLGQPVEATTEIYEGGWRPVRWKDVPQPWNPGVKGEDQIMRGGQMLYTRPMKLTMEARNEEYQAAEQQKRDRVQSALEGKVSGQEGIADIKGVVPRGQTVTIEGEVGTYGGHK